MNNSVCFCAMNFTIITFYKFIELNNLFFLKEEILNFCNISEIKGTILLASEGINATISGGNEAIEKFKYFLRNIDEFADLHFKTSFADFNPFQKMKVRLKKEIVKININDFPIDVVDNYVSSDEWDDLLKDDEVILIDVRNDYETKFGKFKNAILPEIENFHEFPAWFQKFIKKQNNIKRKKIAMYCTGGIRCEKSVSYAKSLGFTNVFHLKNGILEYLKQQKNNKMWQGECFVFDDRVAVTKNIEPTQQLQCSLCRIPTNYYQDLINVTKGKVMCNNCKNEYINAN